MVNTNGSISTKFVGAIAAFVIGICGILAAICGWAYSVEHRLGRHEGILSLDSRVSNLEELLTPIIVEYKVQQELEKRQSSFSPPHTKIYR